MFQAFPLVFIVVGVHESATSCNYKIGGVAYIVVPCVWSAEEYAESLSFVVPVSTILLIADCPVSTHSFLSQLDQMIICRLYILLDLLAVCVFHQLVESSPFIFSSWFQEM